MRKSIHRFENIKETIVLLALDCVEKRNFVPIREFELHQLIRTAQVALGSPFSYIDKPISYSFALAKSLSLLERNHYIDNIIIFRDERATSGNYQLTQLGLAQALDLRTILDEEDHNLLKNFELRLNDYLSDLRLSTL